MNKMLTIIRHAKSTWPDEVIDFERLLNERGLSDAQIMGVYLHQQEFSVDAVFCSSAMRTKQTLQYLGSHGQPLSNDIQYEDELYLASQKKLMNYIADISEQYSHVALIGHNPGLTELYNGFTGDSLANLPTCAAACISFPVDQWAAIDTGLGEKQFLVTPRMVKDGCL